MTTIDRTRLDDLLSGLVRSRGSALHVTPGHPPWIRLEGRVLPDGDALVTAEDLDDLLREFLFADHYSRLERGEEVEILFTSSDGDRFRTLVMPTRDGISVVFRRVPVRIPTFQEVGLPELLGAFSSLRDGLVLVTGFHGSGKRSTLAALVERVNAERPVHVVTVERQIEYIHTSRRAVVHQREVGTHVQSSAAGIRQACDQGADVVFVNDLDDAETLEAVFDTVERGILVFAGFEASGVVGAIADLPQLVSAERRPIVCRRLAASIRGIVSQTLVRRRHGRGRVPLLEILLRNEAITEAIRDGRHDELPDLMLKGRGLGMQTSDMALRSLLQRHLISAEEAAWHASDRDWVLAR